MFFLVCFRNQRTLSHLLGLSRRTPDCWGCGSTGSLAGSSRLAGRNWSLETVLWSINVLSFVTYSMFTYIHSFTFFTVFTCLHTNSIQSQGGYWGYYVQGVPKKVQFETSFFDYSILWALRSNLSSLYYLIVARVFWQNPRPFLMQEAMSLTLKSMSYAIT